MRTALAAVLVFSLVPAMAQAQGASRAYDRYGPAPASRAKAQVAAGYDGPRLSWSGKPAEALEDRPTPLAPWARQAAINPPRPAAPPVSPPAERTQPPAPASGPALPTSIYSPPSPAPSQPATAAPAAAQGPSGVRNYSVLREYGIEPDPLPAPTRPTGQEIVINPALLTGLRRDEPQRASSDGRPNRPDDGRPDNPSAGATERR